MTSHWDEADRFDANQGHLGAAWTLLGEAAGARTVGLRRIEIQPGRWSTPAHVHGAEEEIFYVLGGSGLSWQDGETYVVQEGDCLVHVARGPAHTLRGGDEGLDVLVFGTRIRVEAGVLPRAGVSWLGRAYVELAGEPSPWEREAAVGAPEAPEPSPRPARIVNVGDVPVVERRFTHVGSDWRDLGRAAGSDKAGLKHVRVLPGMLGVPPHCHSAEEEVFVVLDGEGELELWPSPQAVAPAERETHPVRRGSIVARPAGTRVAHTFRAGPSGLTYLAFGTRDPNDMAYYPRSNKIFFRGLGLIARLESLEYGDGED